MVLKPSRSGRAGSRIRAGQRSHGSRSIWRSIREKRIRGISPGTASPAFKPAQSLLSLVPLSSVMASGTVSLKGGLWAASLLAVVKAPPKRKSREAGGPLRCCGNSDSLVLLRPSLPRVRSSAARAPRLARSTCAGWRVCILALSLVTTSWT